MFADSWKLKQKKVVTCIRMKISHSILHPLQVAKQGTFERWVETAGRKRRFLVHIPRRCREAAAGIFILPRPAGRQMMCLRKRTGNGLRKAEPETQ